MPRCAIGSTSRSRSGSMTPDPSHERIEWYIYFQPCLTLFSRRSSAIFTISHTTAWSSASAALPTASTSGISTQNSRNTSLFPVWRRTLSGGVKLKNVLERDAHGPFFSTAGGSQVWVLLTCGPGM